MTSLIRVTSYPKATTLASIVLVWVGFGTTGLVGVGFGLTVLVQAITIGWIAFNISGPIA